MSEVFVVTPIPFETQDRDENHEEKHHHEPEDRHEPNFL